jgi:hypothetical protein
MGQLHKRGMASVQVPKITSFNSHNYSSYVLIVEHFFIVHTVLKLFIYIKNIMKAAGTS